MPSATASIDQPLLRLLSDQFPQAAAFGVRPTPISGGFWAAIYGFSLADAPPAWSGPLVLRVMPNPDLAAKEIVVQTVLAEQGYRTPRVLLSGHDTGLGGAFMIMERAEGKPPLAGLKLGTALLGLPRTLRRLPTILALAARELHDLDPTAVRDALARVPSAADSLITTSSLDAVGHTARIAGGGFPELVAWFDTNTPAPAPEVVCHGDIHPFNLLVTDDGTMSVLDWTSSGLGPREMDLGFTAGLVRCAPIQVPGPLQPVIRRITNRLAERFIASYASTHPVDRSSVDWHEALQYARCLAELANSRLTPGGTVGPDHPFQIAAPAMTTYLAEITGCHLTLPAAGS